MLSTIVVHSPRPIARIRPLIDRLYDQTVRDVDVLVVTTQAPGDWHVVVERYPASLLEMPSGSSVAGLLNAAIGRVTTEVVVTLDAFWMPRDSHWLMSLTRHFADVQLLAVGGADFDPARFSLQQPRYRQDLLDLLAAPEFGLHFGNAALRREAWKRHPFDTQNFVCADKQWAYTLLREEGKLLFDYDARVHQGEPLSQEAAFRRYWDMTLAFGQFIQASQDVKMLATRALSEVWRFKTLAPVWRVLRYWGTIRRQRFWRHDPTHAMLARQQFVRAGGKWAH